MTLPSSQCHPRSGDGETEAQRREGMPPRPPSVPVPITVSALPVSHHAGWAGSSFLCGPGTLQGNGERGLELDGLGSNADSATCCWCGLGHIYLFMPQCSHLKLGTNPIWLIKCLKEGLARLDT